MLEMKGILTQHLIYLLNLLSGTTSYCTAGIMCEAFTHNEPGGKLKYACTKKQKHDVLGETVSQPLLSAKHMRV